MNPEIQVLSAGAVKTGLRAIADEFTRRGQGSVALTFATAPAIKAQVLDGCVADVVAAPPGAMNEFAKAGKIDASARVMLGRVGAGVAVREGAPLPDISSVEALKGALLNADSIAFNKASTGNYLQGLFDRLGLSAALASKIARQDNGAGVLEHLLRSHGRDIGFGAVTEIIVFKDKGVRLVGPLPAEIQNYTSYAAAPMTSARNIDVARAFVAFLEGSEGKAILAACGIEPA